MKNKFYLVTSTFILSVYASHLFFGFNPFDEAEKSEAPKSIRQTPGTSRTYINHSSGFHFGK